MLAKANLLALWMHPEHPLAHKSRPNIRDLDGQDYPLPMGEQFDELREAAMAVINAYGAKPVYRNLLASSFEEFLFSTEQNDVFLMVEHPLDPERDSLICKTLEPAIEHNTYLMVRRDEQNPALRLFSDYVKEIWGAT